MISVFNNKSADLKLIKEVIDYSKDESVNMIRHTHGLIQCDRIMDYVVDKTSEKQNGYPNRIRTVSDAFQALLNIINTNIQYINTRYFYSYSPIILAKNLGFVKLYFSQNNLTFSNSS